MPAADTKKKSKQQQPAAAAKPATKQKSVSKKKPPTPKKTVRSEERVVDSSDEEGETLEETTEAVTTEKSSTDTSETESESESEPEENEDENEPKEKSYNYKYKPPPSFKIIPPGNSSHNPFSAKNLNGKELWFITTPYAAPLSKVDLINPADIAEGLPVLQTSSGRSYCMKVKDGDEDAEVVELFVGDGKGNYRIAGKKIAKSFHMVESLPVAKGVTADKVPQSKSVREQPEGLRMRFKPIGFEGEIEQDGNVEMGDVDVEVGDVDVEVGDVDVEVGDVDVEVRPPRESNEDGELEHKKKKRKSHKEGGEERKREKKHKKIRDANA